MLNSFAEPPPEHRVHALWIWNSKLDPDEVVRQVQEMHNQGFGGFIIETGDGVMAQNSDAELTQALDLSARTAGELGIRAYLHDPRQAFTPPQGQVWSKFLYLLGHIDRTETHNPTARRNLQLLGRFAECFWSAAIEEVKGAIDWQMSLGGTTMLAPRIPFAFEQATGETVDRFYRAPSWRYQRLLADYTARVSYALSQGRSVAQVALLDTSRNPESQVSQIAATYVDIYCRSLLREHIGFDVISEQALANATCVDQQILIDGNAYQALIIPPITAIGPRTAKRIRDFAEDGGAIVGTGLLPYATSRGTRELWIRNTFMSIFNLDPLELEQEAAAGKTPDIGPNRSERNPVQFFALGQETEIATRLRQWLSQIVRLDVSVQWKGSECPDITFAHRILDSGEVFFFANNAGESREVQMSIRCEGAPHLLDPETGRSSALANCTQRAGKTLLLHRFERYGSLLVYFGSEPALSVRRQTNGLDGREVAIPDGWSYVSGNGNGYTLCRADVVIPGFMRGESVVLRADYPSGVVEFAVNSVSAGVRAWAPFEVDITDLVHPDSGNLIEVRDIDVSDGPDDRPAPIARLAIC